MNHTRHEGKVGSFTIMAIQVNLAALTIEAQMPSALLPVIQQLGHDLAEPVDRHGGKLLRGTAIPAIALWPSTEPDERALDVVDDVLAVMRTAVWHDVADLRIALHHGQCIYRLYDGGYRDVFGDGVNRAFNLLEQVRRFDAWVVLDWRPKGSYARLTFLNHEDVFLVPKPVATL
jgi:class 3 adenylate cyclase